MPLAGPLARDRALAHYKHASRYDQEGEPEKSAAHLRRALDYVSFGMESESRKRTKRRSSPSPFQDRPSGSSIYIAPVDPLPKKPPVIPPYDPADPAYDPEPAPPQYDPHDPAERARLLRAENLVWAKRLLEEEEYDPEYPVLNSNLPYDPAYSQALEAEARLKPRRYYTMANPPIHIEFVHPLVNAWFSDDDDGKWTNVYAEVDMEADSYIAASGKTTHPIIMNDELPTEHKKVRLANGESAYCIPFEREFVHGFYCCVVVGARDNKPITVTEVREEGIWGVELDERERTTNVFFDKELKRRRDWGYERLYVLDIPAYRRATAAIKSTTNTKLCVHVPDHPLVNLWILNLYSSEASPVSGTLTNVYARDTKQLRSCATPADDSTRILTSLIVEQPSIPIHLEHAYPFLKRANTQRPRVRILNKPALEAILTGPRPPEKDLHIKAVRAFLHTNVSPTTRKLVVPDCFVSLQHAFTCERGHLVTIKPIEPNHTVPDPDNPGYKMRPESFSLLGVWAVDSQGRKGVRVFTTEAAYLDSYNEEQANQQKARDRDSSRKH